jgi:hypothetical protein
MKIDEVRKLDVRTRNQCWGSDRKTGLDDEQRRVRVRSVFRGLKFDSKLGPFDLQGPDSLLLDALSPA